MSKQPRSLPRLRVSIRALIGLVVLFAIANAIPLWMMGLKTPPGPPERVEYQRRMIVLGVNLYMAFLMANGTMMGWFREVDRSLFGTSERRRPKWGKPGFLAAALVVGLMMLLLGFQLANPGVRGVMASPIWPIVIIVIATVAETCLMAASVAIKLRRCKLSQETGATAPPKP